MAAPGDRASVEEQLELSSTDLELWQTGRMSESLRDQVSLQCSLIDPCAAGLNA